MFASFAQEIGSSSARKTERLYLFEPIKIEKEAMILLWSKITRGTLCLPWHYLVHFAVGFRSPLLYDLRI